MLSFNEKTLLNNIETCVQIIKETQRTSDNILSTIDNALKELYRELEEKENVIKEQ